jgi:predicted dehydrogenase
MGYLRWGALFGSRSTNDTILDGTKGSLRLDMNANVVYRRLLGEKEWTEHHPEPTENPVVRELRHFVECAEQNKTPLVDGREGRRAVELVLASYRSADEGGKVKLPM